VHDVGVGEVADDLNDRVGLADDRQEAVSETLALRGPGRESRDVDELDRATGTRAWLGSMVENA
jgi:hypothetical protein